MACVSKVKVGSQKQERVLFLHMPKKLGLFFRIHYPRSLPVASTSGSYPIGPVKMNCLFFKFIGRTRC